MEILTKPLYIPLRLLLTKKVRKMTNPKRNMCIGCHTKNIVVAKSVGIKPQIPEPKLTVIGKHNSPLFNSDQAEQKPTLGLTCRCEKCRFIGNLDEFEVTINIESHKSDISISCPKCHNRIDANKTKSVEYVNSYTKFISN